MKPAWLLALLFLPAFAGELRVRSGRADMVTGGAALVEASGAGRVRLNGEPSAATFRADPEGRSLALVEGLKPGRNVLELGAARLEVVNYPATGPVFSGPHQSPFVCQSAAAGLGEPRDSDCSAPTKIEYFYRSTETPPAGEQRGAKLPAGFKPYDPEQPRPADLARTTTERRAVDYIVRRETGTINRGIYEIAILHDPRDPAPDPWTRPAGWNGRLVYFFGASCAAGYRQGLPPAALSHDLLARGYAVATSSQSSFGNNCNDVISAETLMMVKEHFIERYGIPAYTIGSGGSGGSMQQYLAVQNYPGLLDGITPSSSYPDVVTVVPGTVDCKLLDRAFSASKLEWTEEQKAAVAGYANWETCASWNRSYSPAWVEARHCHALVKTAAWDPASNPSGARCSIYDNEVNVFGRDPKTGFARRPLDNVGVQYGLAAFNSGKIPAAQFVELNELIGGYDPDGNLVPQRTAADPESVRLAYANGVVNTGGGGLGSVPIIDFRPYVDRKGNIHDSYRSFAARARILAAQGSAANHVILVRPSAPFPAHEAIAMVDGWLAAVARDHATGTLAEKVARNKPAGLDDTCWTEDGEKIAGPQSYRATDRCSEMYPAHAGPRLAAGAPFADDVLKCALKPLAPSDYQQDLTPEQVDRLRRVFPDGVCDYSRPGIGQHWPRETWRRF